jgi:4-alpha-glucanotransferase
LRFAFGVHFHQPVGNFDHVFEQHVRDVYRPFLERLAERDFLPIAVHISGPLLEWLEAREAALLDRIARLAADGRLELLLAGFYEPVLVALPRDDRLEQIDWMRQAIRRRFGVEAGGLWLTERVWEPELAADLADAGVRYVLVDDRHFLVSGFERERLHVPYWTESGGKRVAVFSIDERLRYLVPFKPPADTVAYLRALREGGAPLAVLADDGEKFGGWPGTKEWVYERGWLGQFLDAMAALVESGEVRLTTPSAALAEVPSGGLAYLPTASYREMEGWALPPAAALRLARLERDLGAQRVAGPDGALLRGAHWRNFLARYPEANRMHKKTQALSALCRDRGDPSGARRAIGRAQCNDAYWHGVFGGLYLPHLRQAVWHNLTVAERELRRNEGLAFERLDVDGDGVEEVWIHSSAFSALVSPRRGGAIEEYSLLKTGINYADVLTRRREAYHELTGKETKDPNARPGDGTPSIHEIEKGMRLDRLPPVDRDARALLVDRVLPGDLTLGAYASGEYDPIASWAGAPVEAEIRASGEVVEVTCRASRLEKRIRFTAAGGLTVSYRWDPAAFPGDALFAPEISLARALELKCSPAADVWSFPIVTISKSERGLDQTVQGSSLTPRWPAAVGQARVEVLVPSRKP